MVSRKKVCAFMMMALSLMGLAAAGQEVGAAAAVLDIKLRESGVTPPEALQVIDGKDALVHVFREREWVALTRLVSDMSGYNALSLVVSSRLPLAGCYSIIFNSEDKDKTGADYYSLSLPARFSGTHELLIPLSELSRTRSSRGLDQIDAIRYRGLSGRTRQPPTNIMTPVKCA